VAKIINERLNLKHQFDSSEGYLGINATKDDINLLFKGIRNLKRTVERII
jgi:hypothetical protein